MICLFCVPGNILSVCKRKDCRIFVNRVLYGIREMRKESSRQAIRTISFQEYRSRIQEQNTDTKYRYKVQEYSTGMKRMTGRNR